MDEPQLSQLPQLTQNSENTLETGVITTATLDEHELYTQSIPDTSGQEILLSFLSASLPSQRDLVNNDWCKDYLNRLTSLSLESLKHEPLLVEDEQLKIQKELAELSFREYKSCIHANTCSTEINSSLDNLNLHLSTLTSTIPLLENSCSSFLQQTNQIIQQRGKINTILECHDNLLEILEIPQLMDTCVRNGLYSEAMDLSAHVARLVSKYSTISLIQRIERDVKQTMQLMLSKLITLLSQQIKLPSCLKVIGYLRRMEAFDEAELRLVFLLSRDAYLRSLIRTIDKEKKDPVYYLKKYIDIFRENFFDIVTQYRAIFSDEGGGLPSTPIYSSLIMPPTPSSSSSPWLSSSITDSNTTNFFGRRTMTAATAISDYTIHILGQLTSVLAEFTPLISDTSSLSSILTQLMYCGMSLGRVGVDFRHLVTGYFETAVERIVKKMITDGTQEFCDDLKQAIKNVDLPNTWMIGDKKSINLLDLRPSSSSTSTASSFTPLVTLLDYPPIAHLTNAYLSAFNSLRLVAPVSLFHPLGNHISQSLTLITDLLREYGVTLINHNHDITVLQGFNAMFAQSFVPFISRCFVDGVYGGLISGDGVDHPEIISKSKILDTLKDFLPTSTITPSNLIDNNKLSNDIPSIEDNKLNNDIQNIDDNKLLNNDIPNDIVTDEANNTNNTSEE
ncbi:Dor1-like family-domain-containing protein [Gigaspora rosea]|uniref:Conserved oligomeric Golgi complex subunit 8 n=1 Tax=Gigaspora rosea TaxID=44941 RepID=A0A397VPP9_9GLOM|nr:Dor1-like family-domain-containing protein [Gigaspora rosea]